MPSASSVHNIGGWVNFTQRWVSDVDMWGRPASPRLAGLRLAPSGTDLLVNIPDCLLKSVVGCLGPMCGVARPVTWNFHQIHPINFHCVVDGHHKSATWFPWIWLSLLRVVAVRSMVKAFHTYLLYFLVYPVHRGTLGVPNGLVARNDVLGKGVGLAAAFAQQESETCDLHNFCVRTPNWVNQMSNSIISTSSSTW